MEQRGRNRNQKPENLDDLHSSAHKWEYDDADM